MPLTIQIFHHGQWQDAAELVIDDPAEGRRGTARLGYHTDYALEWMNRDDEHACSLRLPVELMLTYRSKHWFGFLDDIMPSGASRRYWVTKLGLQDLPSHRQDYELLRYGTIAPVGNLRIKDSLPALPSDSRLRDMRFPLRDAIERHTDFLEYAQQMGAASGGATGAGGEAPKLLLCCSPDDDIWIDTYQDDSANRDRRYLVKFPRGQRSAIDCDILRAEYHYYQELDALGVETIDTHHMRLIEGERYPSLWLPRFDVTFIDDKRDQFGLESLYALLDKPPGSFLNHFEVIRALVDKLSGQYRVSELGEALDTEALVVEMVQRDLLNVVFGNSDNHGRNTALIKRPQGIWLSPIYDFAPMKADPEGVTRTTTWGSPYEEGGRFDWPAIAEQLADLVPAETLLAELGALAEKLLGLKSRLAARGVPSRILEMPTLGFDYLDRRLQDWGLV